MDFPEKEYGNFVYNYMEIKNNGFIMNHSCGFFSNCSICLDYIIKYYNDYKKLPDYVDTSRSWSWYKPVERENENIFHEYFDLLNDKFDFSESVKFRHDCQYLNYKLLPYNNLNKFISLYFKPNQNILNIVKEIENEYMITDYSNICCLFYRGNDKITEASLPSYENFIEQARKYKENNPNTKFLIQSDETEFLENMINEFPNSVILYKYIRHIKKNCNDTVDKQNKGLNFLFSKYFLAIVLIMSKCNHLIFTTGNISMWICLFRQNANGIEQYLENSWV